MRLTLKVDKNKEKRFFDSIKRASEMRAVANRELEAIAEEAIANTKATALRRRIYDTGQLHRNIGAGRTPGGAPAIIREGGNTVGIKITSEALSPRGYDYAPAQEYGTARIHPRPYFYTSIAEVLNKHTKRLMERLVKFVKTGK